MGIFIKKKDQITLIKFFTVCNSVTPLKILFKLDHVKNVFLNEFYKAQLMFIL